MLYLSALELNETMVAVKYCHGVDSHIASTYKLIILYYKFTAVYRGGHWGLRFWAIFLTVLRYFRSKTAVLGFHRVQRYMYMVFLPFWAVVFGKNSNFVRYFGEGSFLTVLVRHCGFRYLRLKSCGFGDPQCPLLEPLADSNWNTFLLDNITDCYMHVIVFRIGCLELMLSSILFLCYPRVFKLEGFMSR